MQRLGNLYGDQFDADQPEIHPKMFCNRCYANLANSEMRGSDLQKLFEWHTHTDDCRTCSHMENKSKGATNLIVDQKEFIS